MAFPYSATLPVVMKTIKRWGRSARALVSVTEHVTKATSKLGKMCRCLLCIAPTTSHSLFKAMVANNCVKKQ